MAKLDLRRARKQPRRHSHSTEASRHLIPPRRTLRRVSPVALAGFRGGGAGSRNQACDKGAEQGSPTPARVVHELEEAEIERQLVLRDAPVRAEPGAQQGPEPFHGVDVHLAEAVPVLVAGILTPGMADRLVLIAPGG